MWFDHSWFHPSENWILEQYHLVTVICQLVSVNASHSSSLKYVNWYQYISSGRALVLGTKKLVALL